MYFFADDAQPRRIEVNSIHIQEEGIFNLFSPNQSEAFEIHTFETTVKQSEFTTCINRSKICALFFCRFKVYGGGSFSCDAILYWDAENLFAIYPGGEINLDHSGYKPATWETYMDEIGEIQGKLVVSYLSYTDTTRVNTKKIYLVHVSGRGSGSGGSGGGHAGTGGRGGGVSNVGMPHSSMYEPIGHGGPGGHGASFGKKYA